MATIRKRRWRSASDEVRERWQVDFVDQAGKRRHKQFDRKKDADAYLTTARGQVRAGTYTPESFSISISDAAQLWLDRGKAEQLEPSTLAQYRQHVAHILAAIDPDTKIAKLTRARCEQLRDDLLIAHSRQLARKILQSFRSILKEAMRRGLVAQNVAAETTIGAAGRHKRRLEVGVDIPTPGEVKALIETASPKARAMVCLAALAGLRASELRGLRWSDLDLGTRPAVTVSQRADAQAAIGSPKSATSRRTVPLGETAAQSLRAWKLAQPPRRSLVFGTGTDRPDMLGNLQKRLLTPLTVSAGVPRYSWHALRHYAVSSWLASGIDLKTCQHWAGHATLALTLDTYGPLIPRRDDHQRIADAEQGLFG